MDDLAALIDAAKAGQVPEVRALLQHNPGLARARLSTGETPLMSALYQGHHGVVAALIEAGAELDVFAAAATGKTDELRLGLQAGAVNLQAYDGWTPLHLAAFFGQLEAARLLLAAGADVHAISRNSLANTPLHAATAGKHGDVAILLLAHGADAHVADAGGYSPLQIATQNQLAAVVTAMTGKD